MLGSMAYDYLSKKHNVIELNDRISESNVFQIISKINNLNPKYILNCIGAIPQKQFDHKNMYFLNALLPAILRNGINDCSILIQPSTDCVFSGKKDFKYCKTDKKDASDIYGRSKAIAEDTLIDQENLIIIRTSIIGATKNFADKGLLSWFVNTKSRNIDGYTNHFWNGITTLEWSKQVNEMMVSEVNKGLFQIGTEEISSKYKLLEKFKSCFEKEININEYECDERINRTLESDLIVPCIEAQLDEFADFKKR